jgi:DNA polymerase-3 subunit epsilon
LEVTQGHRIIEIGCVELLNRRITGRNYHQYVKPDREIDEGAVEVHGISNAFLDDKPVFGDIVGDFLEFVSKAELIIHNAPFDMGFLNEELRRLDDEFAPIEMSRRVLDTLELARTLHPGQKNSLDALCRRYGIDNSRRELHGALLDARLLADVYLAMTGGQTSLSLVGDQELSHKGASPIRRLPTERAALKVILASNEEQSAHETWLREIDEASGGNCVWLRNSN